MKIAFIDAGILNQIYLEQNGGVGLRLPRLESLGIQYLAAVSKENGHEVKLYQHSFDNSLLFNNILGYEPDIIAVSSMTCNFPYALDFAEKIKSNNPNIQTVFGGSHSSDDPHIVNNDCVDIAVLGEGELTFGELLHVLENRNYGNSELNDVKGISFYDSDKESVKINPPRNRITDLDMLPWPVRDQELINECKGYGLTVVPPSKQKVVSFVYSRGCPRSCDFCDSKNIWGSKFIYRSAKNTAEEIQSVVQEYNPNFMFFADLDFTLDKRKVKELCKEIQNREINIPWNCLSSINVDEKTLESMKEAGCAKISYGIEFFEKELLDSVHKRQEPDKAKETIGLTHDAGIFTNAFMMIDPRTADEQTFQSYLLQLKESLPEEVRMTFLTPFPNTPLYRTAKAEKTLLSDDWRRYTTEEPIMKGKLPPHRLIEQRNLMLKKYYMSDEYRKSAEINTKKHPVMKQSYKEFFSHLKTIGIL